MRSDLIRTYKTLHTWTGIVSGLLLFIAFYAGALAVFEPALARWAAAPSPHVTPLAQAEALIARVAAEHPQAQKQLTLHLGQSGEIPARVTWRASRDAEVWFGADLDHHGALKVTTLNDEGLGQFIDHLHRVGGLPMDDHDGATVMGVVSACYFLALVSGLIIVLPTLARDLLALRIGPNLKRMWMDAHNLAGIVSLPFHIVIAVTAVVFGLHDPIYGALDKVVLRGGMQAIQQSEGLYAKIPRDPSPAAMLPPGELLARLAALSPDLRPYAIEYRNVGTGGAAAAIWGHDDRHLERGRGFAAMSAVTGEIVNTQYLPGHQDGYGPAVSSFFALHFASFGGAPVKWTYLALGLAGAFLFYSGNLLWIESRRKRERGGAGTRTQSRASRWMAAGTVGVCLGCVAGVSVAIAASKWLPGRVADPELWRWGVYYAVFLPAVGWAFGRGAARAGVELLWAAAAATLLIPLTTLLAWTVPALGLWSWTDTLGVDAVALAGAVALALCARAAARRVRDGNADSVWSGAAPQPAPQSAPSPAA